MRRIKRCNDQASGFIHIFNGISIRWDSHIKTIWKMGTNNIWSVLCANDKRENKNRENILL
jgi:hypothetical protein